MDTLPANELLQNQRIAIVGGGPGGLALARLLQLQGATVNVYERDAGPEARVQGAIVDLHAESGLKVLAKAGLLEAFRAAYLPGADKYRLVDKHAAICFDEPAGPPNGEFGSAGFRPEIDRGALRTLLLAALQPGTVVWDSHFRHMEPVGAGWKLTFANGTTAVADLVVGADGARSKIRPYMTDIRARYAGATIIQGEIEHPEQACPEMNELVDKANLIALGDGKSLTVQPRGDGGLTFYASAEFPEDWVSASGIDFQHPEEVVAFLRSFFEGWHPVFFTLFSACGKFTPRPLRYFPLDQRWETHANVTLIGDAAHLMPPSGEGVNTAMLDALDLSTCLTSGVFSERQAAIAAYEAHAQARATKLGQEAMAGITEMYTADALAETVAMFRQAHHQQNHPGSSGNGQ